MARDRFRVPLRAPEIFLDDEEGTRIAPIPVRRGIPVNPLLADLATNAAIPAPLSASERERNAARARQIEAERAREGRSGFEVRPREMLRELGDIASMYGLRGVETIADAGSAGLPDVEYDPVALGSSFNPLSDEAIGLAERLRGNSYRAAQAAAEQRFEQAQEASPNSSLAGALGSMAVLGPAMEGAGAARMGGAGAALGGAGGFLGSEGETWGNRALETGRGAILGGALGAGAGRLNALGAAMRAAPASSFANAVARGSVGTALEGGGQGIAMGALGSGGRVTDPLYEGGRVSELVTDPLAIGGAGTVAGGLLGLPGGIARGARRVRMPDRLPGIAPEVTGDVADEAAQEIGQYFDDSADDLGAASAPTGDLGAFDPRAVIAAHPAPERSAAETVLGMSMEDPAIATVKAAGGMDRAVQRQLARVMGGGQRGLERAADVIREAGIFEPGEVTTLGETLRRNELLRDAARSALERGHARVTAAREVIPGNEVAARLRADADDLARGGGHSDAVLAEIGNLRRRAASIEYGTPDDIRALGRSAATLEDAPLVEAQMLPDDVAELPGIEPEVIGYNEAETARRMTRPTLYPYEVARQRMAEAARHARTFAPGQVPTPGTSRELLQSEYNAWVPSRNAATARALPADEVAAMQRANRTFRVAETLAPSDSIASSRLRSEGLLRGALARTQGGPLAFLRGLAERSYAQHEPSVQAALAHGIVPSTPGQRAFAGRLGNVAERLQLPAEVAAALPVAAINSRLEPRRVAEAQAEVARREAATRRAASEDDEQGGFARFAVPTLEEQPPTPEEEDEQGGFARFAR